MSVMYLLTFDNSNQSASATGDFFSWMTVNAPDAFDPIWEIHFNGGDDTFVPQGWFQAGTWNETWGLITVAIFGGTGNDTLMGDGGNDTLDGGIGEDTFYDSPGNDTYVFDSIGDQVIEYPNSFPSGSSGSDTIQSSVDYNLPAIVETLVLIGTADINAGGNSLRNALIGNSGANILDGLQGADTLIGGAGDDVYVIDSTFDQVIERANQGIDIIETGVSFTLSAFVEQGFLNSAGRNQSLTGNTLGNLLVGNSGMNTLSGLDGKDELRGEGGADSLNGGTSIDTLDGGAGADRMDGGLGNDLYYVDNGLDVVIELLDGGYDTVFTSTAIALPDHVEKLVFNGLADGTMLSGNDLANFLVGNYTDDIIDVGAGSDSAAGGSGDDTLLGGTGNDTLLGEFGIDSIEGGLGRDILIGGAGADLFVFVGVTDSAGANRDLIKDFEDGLDRIDLRQLDAGATPGDQAFTFIGDQAFSAAGQVRVTTTATTTRIEVSLDEDTDTEMLILLNGIHALTAADFIL